MDRQSGCIGSRDQESLLWMVGDVFSFSIPFSHVRTHTHTHRHTTEKEAKQALDRLPREVEDEPLIKYLKARPEVRLVEKSRLQLRNTSKQSVIHTLVSPNTHGYKHRNSISHTPMHAAGYRALMKTPRTVARSVTTPKSIE